MATGSARNAHTNRHAAQAENQRRRKRKRKGNKTLHYILLLMFVLAAGAALSLTVLFKIEAVEVLGNDRYAPEDIIADSGIQVGENLFRISGAEVSPKLTEKYPYIEKVVLRRKFPPKIQIEITQGIPAAALKEGETVTLITRQGKVLEQGFVFIPPGVPLVKGIGAGEAIPGAYLGEECREALKMLDYLFQAMQETDFGSITNVDLTDRLNMRVVYENRLILELGTEAELPYKLKFIKTLLETKLEPDDEGILDATDISKNKVVFRQQPIGENQDALQADKPEEEQTDVQTEASSAQEGS